MSTNANPKSATQTAEDRKAPAPAATSDASDRMPAPAPQPAPAATSDASDRMVAPAPQPPAPAATSDASDRMPAPAPQPAPPPPPASSHHVPVSPLRHPNPVPQNRLSPYLPGAARERASSFPSLGPLRAAGAPIPGGPVGPGVRDRSRSFGHSYSSPVPSPHGQQQGGRPRITSSGVGTGVMFMPMIPNLSQPPATPPCTPIGAPTKKMGGPAGIAAAPPPVGTVSPSVLRARSRAVENALENERARAKELEGKEAGMDADQLRQALKRERAHSARLAADLAGMWSSAVQSQAEAEVHEEGRINNLMRRLDRLQKEKGRIIVELEREEEMLTNTLQKKLNEVRREKALLEQQIEREHESKSKLRRQQQQQQQQQQDQAEEKDKGREEAKK